MDKLDQALVFAETCSKGHRLLGRVKYCPFCGVAVVQPNAETVQVDTPSPPPMAEMELQKNEIAAQIQQPALPPKIKVTVSEPAKSVPSPIPEPIKVPASESEQPVQPEMKPQHQFFPAPQPPLESPKSEPSPSPVPPSDKKKSFLKWAVVIGGLIVLLILIQMFGGGKIKPPETIGVPLEATRHAPDPTLVSKPRPSIKPSPQKSSESFSAAEQPAPATSPEKNTTSEVRQKPTEIAALALKPAPKEDCPTGEVTSKARSMINGNNWGEALQFINRQLDQNSACSSNKELLMLQDIALELNKYIRDKNPRSARSGFDSLIDKYGNKSDLTKMRGVFNDALNKENDCAASGRTWDPANFFCN